MPFPEAVDPRFMCKKHADQKIVIYCRNCKVFACTVCGLTAHTGPAHKCIETDEADFDFQTVIHMATIKCEDTIATRRQKIEELEKELSEEKRILKREERQFARCQSLMSLRASFVDREEAAKVIQNRGYLDDDSDYNYMSSRFN